MSLPVIPKKIFDVKSKFLPKGKVSLTPFTVGLENILLQVKDAEEEKEKMEAIGQVVQACIQTPGVDAKTLPLFLVEEIFLRLREHSIGEIIDQSYQCTNVKEDGTICNKVIPVQIDLREFKLVEVEGHKNVITVADTIGVKFQYPSIQLFENSLTDTSDEIQTIISCIDSIFDADNVYPANEHTREELQDFWKSLDLKQKKEVYDSFFHSMPHMHYQKEITCPSCGCVHNIEFNSIGEVFQ